MTTDTRRALAEGLRAMLALVGLGLLVLELPVLWWLLTNAPR